MVTFFDAKSLQEMLVNIAKEQRASLTDGRCPSDEFQQGMRIGGAVAYELAAKWIGELLVKESA